MAVLNSPGLTRQTSATDGRMLRIKWSRVGDKAMVRIHSIQESRKGLQISMDRPGQARVQNPKSQTGQWEFDSEAKIIE